MEQVIEFVIRHWQLWLCLGVVVGALVATEMRTSIQGVMLALPQQVVELINHKQAFIIDLRDKAAMNQGMILGAQEMTASEIEQHPNKLNPYKQQATVLIHAQQQQAIQVGARLRQQGFAEVYVLKGGMNAWINAGLPLHKKGK